MFLTSQAEVVEGSLVIHTKRNKPDITRNGVVEDVSTGKIIKANNLKISCKKKQYVSLKFSNETVVEILPETEIEITSFTQEQPFEPLRATTEASLTKLRFNSISKLHLKLNCGKIRVVALEQRGLSEFIIHTRLGKFDIKSTQFEMQDNSQEILTSVIEGKVSFKSKQSTSTLNTNIGDVDCSIRNKQKGSIEDKSVNTNFPLKIEAISMLEEEQMLPEFAACKQVQDSILFMFDASKKLIAKRVIFKEFLLKKPKYNY